jgi:ABC-2 type transport system permease protein
MKVFYILKKEWLEILRNKFIIFNMFLIPAILISLPLFVAFSIERVSIPTSEDELESLYPSVSLNQDLAAEQEELRVIILNQSMLMFLMIPILLPLGIVLYSIINEKNQRSLEPLLATPIKVWELLTGKGLSTAIPTVLITWLAFVVFATVLRFTVKPSLYVEVIKPMTILSVIVLPILLTTMAVCAGIIISSLVNDIRLAQQIGSLIVLPIVALAITQVASKISHSVTAFLLGLAGFAALDTLMFCLMLKAFRRESILTRWQ